MIVVFGNRRSRRRSLGTNGHKLCSIIFLSQISTFNEKGKTTLILFRDFPKTLAFIMLSWLSLTSPPHTSRFSHCKPNWTAIDFTIRSLSLFITRHTFLSSYNLLRHHCCCHSLHCCSKGCIFILISIVFNFFLSLLDVLIFPLWLWLSAFSGQCRSGSVVCLVESTSVSANGCFILESFWLLPILCFIVQCLKHFDSWVCVYPCLSSFFVCFW